MLKKYIGTFLVIEIIMLALVMIDAPINSPLYTSIMGTIMIAILGTGSFTLFTILSTKTKNRMTNSILQKLGLSMILIVAFILLRLITHLALLGIVVFSKVSSQVSGVTQVTIVLVYFYVMYDITKDLISASKR